MAKVVHNVAVIGCGFAGYRALRVLCRNKKVAVTLFEPREALAMLPSLPDVAGGWMTAKATEASYRKILPSSIKLEKNKVQKIDLDKRAITTASGTFKFDAIMIACGARAVPCPFNKDEKQAYILDSTASAEKIYNDFGRYIKTAANPHVVLAGAGYTGLELATSLAARAKAERKTCPIYVIDIGVEILPFLPSKKRKTVINTLESLAIKFIPNARVSGWDGQNVTVGDYVYQNAFFCWTVGTTFSIPEVNGKVERINDGRIKVNADLSLSGHTRIFAVGDAAAVMHKGSILRKAVNFAWYGGPLAARNVVAALEGRSTKKYRPVDLGWAIPLHITGIGTMFNKIWFGGRFALRIHYAMCALRSVSLSQQTEFFKMALKLYKK